MPGNLGTDERPGPGLVEVKDNVQIDIPVELVPTDHVKFVMPEKCPNCTDVLVCQSCSYTNDNEAQRCAECGKFKFQVYAGNVVKEEDICDGHRPKVVQKKRKARRTTSYQVEVIGIGIRKTFSVMSGGYGCFRPAARALSKMQIFCMKHFGYKPMRRDLKATNIKKIPKGQRLPDTDRKSVKISVSFEATQPWGTERVNYTFGNGRVAEIFAKTEQRTLPDKSLSPSDLRKNAVRDFSDEGEEE
jgi:hypothetical protein